MIRLIFYFFYKEEKTKRDEPNSTFFGITNKEMKEREEEEEKSEKSRGVRFVAHRKPPEEQHNNSALGWQMPEIWVPPSSGELLSLSYSLTLCN